MSYWIVLFLFHPILHYYMLYYTDSLLPKGILASHIPVRGPLTFWVARLGGLPLRLASMYVDRQLAN